MKISKLFSRIIGIILIAIITILIGCAKKTEANSCRTCSARYQGSVVATKNACSSDDEQSFKSQYYYAEVRCQ